METLVLILVVMEDALARYFTSNNNISRISLNPCCNGRCTRTSITFPRSTFDRVLILVVMEDALARVMARKKQNHLQPS